MGDMPQAAPHDATPVPSRYATDPVPFYDKQPSSAGNHNQDPNVPAENIVQTTDTSYGQAAHTGTYGQQGNTGYATVEQNRYNNQQSTAGNQYQDGPNVPSGDIVQTPDTSYRQAADTGIYGQQEYVAAEPNQYTSSMSSNNPGSGSSNGGFYPDPGSHAAHHPVVDTYQGPDTPSNNDFLMNQGLNGISDIGLDQLIFAGHSQSQPAPPATTNYPTEPPANNNYPTEPPANNNYHTEPPANNNYHTEPPANNNYPTEPPANNNYPNQPPRFSNGPPPPNSGGNGYIEAANEQYQPHNQNQYNPRVNDPYPSLNPDYPHVQQEPQPQENFQRRERGGGNANYQQPAPRTQQTRYPISRVVGGGPDQRSSYLHPPPDSRRSASTRQKDPQTDPQYRQLSSTQHRQQPPPPPHRPPPPQYRRQPPPTPHRQQPPYRQQQPPPAPPTNQQYRPAGYQLPTQNTGSYDRNGGVVNPSRTRQLSAPNTTPTPPFLYPFMDAALEAGMFCANTVLAVL